jgi:hypothetical protein
MCSFEFNDNDQLLSQLYENVNNGQKTNYYQILFKYDDDYNLLSGEYNRWVAGTWQPYDYSFSFSDYYGNEFGLYAAKFDLSYSNSTNIIEIIDPNGILSIYPNPTSGEISVELDNLQEPITSYSIFNSLGNEVDGKHNIQSIQHTNKLLFKEDLNHLPSGVYYFVIKGRNKSYMNKIIIEK